MGHKSSLSKFKKSEITLSIFSDHNAVRSQRQKKYKKHKHMEAKNILLNNLEITKEIKEETRKYIETNDNKNILTQNL